MMGRQIVPGTDKFGIAGRCLSKTVVSFVQPADFSECLPQPVVGRRKIRIEADRLTKGLHGFVVSLLIAVNTPQSVPRFVGIGIQPDGGAIML